MDSSDKDTITNSNSTNGKEVNSENDNSKGSSKTNMSIKSESFVEKLIKTEIFESSGFCSISKTGERNGNTYYNKDDAGTANMSSKKEKSTKRSFEENLIKTEKEFNANSNTLTGEETVYENNNSMEEDQKVQLQFKNAPKENMCNHCKEFFDDPIMLLCHKRETHNYTKTVLPLEEIKKYYDYPNRSVCPICKKVIKNNNYRSRFLQHLHTHTVLLVFECAICKKKFSRKNNMLDHQKRHVVPSEDISLEENS